MAYGQKTRKEKGERKRGRESFILTCKGTGIKLLVMPRRLRWTNRCQFILTTKSGPQTELTPFPRIPYGTKRSEQMIGYAQFSSLRIAKLFRDAPEVRENREMWGHDDCRTGVDSEGWGGLWAREDVSGVVLLFPEVAPDLVGVIQVSIDDYSFDWVK